MSVTDIVTTAQDFLLDTGATLTMEASVPEMLETLARMCPVFGNVGVIYNDGTITDGVFPLPANVLQVLSVHFFPRELEPAGVRWAQDTLDPTWRTRTGLPTRYTQELGTTQQVRLHPIPTMTGAMGLPPFQGIPGAPPPTNHLVTFVLDAPAVEDVAPWWEDLVAYLLAAWEAFGEGVREDVPQAQALLALVQMLVGLLKDLHHAPGEELMKGAWQMPFWANLPQT